MGIAVFCQQIEVHCKLLLRPAAGKATSFFYPLLYSLFWQYFISKWLAFLFLHLILKTKLILDIDVIMLQHCLHLNRSCKSLAVFANVNCCFSKCGYDHLHIFKSKVWLG